MNALKFIVKCIVFSAIFVGVEIAADKIQDRMDASDAE